MKLYRVYDSKAEIFGRIVEERTDESARRAFGASVASEEGPHASHPEDFSLWRVGQANEDTGEVVGETPTRIWTGLEARMSNTETD